IGQQKKKPVNDRACDADQLLLTSGKLVGIQIFFRYDLKTVEYICDQALPFLAGNVFVGEWKVDVLLHRKVIKQVIALKDHADLTLRESRALFTLHRVNRLVAEPEFPFPAIIEQSQDIQQERLARTRRPHNRDEFALADFKIDATKYPDL